MKLPAEFFSIAVTAIFVQNIVMVYMLISNVFVSAVKSPVSWIKYGVLVTISTTLASMLAWVLNKFVLERFNLGFLSAFSFIFILVLMEFIAELVLRKFAPALRKKIGGVLPASVFNVAILGLMFIDVQMNTRGILGTAFYGFCAGLGFIIALLIASNALERVTYSTPPRAFRGLPIALITASLISLAFMGFSGIRIPY
jgi:Na+-translocating ferredoxin:NAD+ oxidoreductase subunit A